MRIVPLRIAAVKRGARPNSPRLTAEVSKVSTAPAPIRRSACMVEVGNAMRCSRLMPRRMSARVAAIGTPELSRGTARTQPSAMGASASSRERAMVGIPGFYGRRCCTPSGQGALLPMLETGQELENNRPMPMLKDKLATDRFVITAEITPPVSCAAADLMARAAPLKGLADAVNVTDGAGARAHLASVAAAAILIEEGIEPILQPTCRDRNRIALQSDLMGAAALGIRNLLLLKGDDPKQGDQPDAKPVFDYETAALTAVAVAMREKGELPTGTKISGKADFFIAAADVPIDPKPDWEPKSLKAKLVAGCEFVQTQFCMDAGV